MITIEQLKEYLEKGYTTYIVTHDTNYCGCDDTYNVLLSPDVLYSNLEYYVDNRAYDHIISMGINDWIMDELNDHFETDYATTFDIEDKEEFDYYDNLENDNLNQSIQEVYLDPNNEISLKEFIEYANEDNFVIIDSND